MRWAIMLAMALVLTSATFVGAECGWVFWEHVERSDLNATKKTYEETSNWKLHHAYQNNDLCERAKGHVWEVEAANMDKNSSPGFIEVKKVPGELLISTIKWKDGSSTWTHTYLCIPDSIDPRERK